jgi:hypothetical protein
MNRWKNPKHFFESLSQTVSECRFPAALMTRATFRYRYFIVNGLLRSNPPPPPSKKIQFWVKSPYCKQRQSLRRWKRHITPLIRFLFLVSESIHNLSTVVYFLFRWTVASVFFPFMFTKFCIASAHGAEIYSAGIRPETAYKRVMRHRGYHTIIPMKAFITVTKNLKMWRRLCFHSTEKRALKGCFHTSNNMPNL